VTLRAQEVHQLLAARDALGCHLDVDVDHRLFVVRNSVDGAISDKRHDAGDRDPDNRTCHLQYSHDPPSLDNIINAGA
jgi:hypothetical protein